MPMSKVLAEIARVTEEGYVEGYTALRTPSSEDSSHHPKMC